MKINEIHRFNGTKRKRKVKRDVGYVNHLDEYLSKCNGFEQQEKEEEEKKFQRFFSRVF